VEGNSSSGARKSVHVVVGLCFIAANNASEDVSDENSLCGLTANNASEKDISDENNLC
jgi:hypothetical protein